MFLRSKTQVRIKIFTKIINKTNKKHLKMLPRNYFRQSLAKRSFITVSLPSLDSRANLLSHRSILNGFKYSTIKSSFSIITFEHFF